MSNNQSTNNNQNSPQLSRQNSLADKEQAQKRKDKIYEIVGRSRLDQQFNQLPPELILEIGDSWAISLEGLPFDLLEACYVAAIRKHSPKDGPFGVGEIWAQWEAIKASQQYTKIHSSTSEDEALCTKEGKICTQCYGTGWKKIEIEKQTKSTVIGSGFARSATVRCKCENLDDTKPLEREAMPLEVKQSLKNVLGARVFPQLSAWNRN